jgi:hypothetical protein
MDKIYHLVAFLGGLMRAHTIRNALVVAPLSVLQSWEKQAHLAMSHEEVLRSENHNHCSQVIWQRIAVGNCCRKPYHVLSSRRIFL